MAFVGSPELVTALAIAGDLTFNPITDFLTNEKGEQLVFHLSPNDLVYIPGEDEKGNLSNINQFKLTSNHENMIYKFVSCTESEGHFVPHTYSSPIQKNEMGTNNKSQNTIDGNIQIKSCCWKIKVDKIGNVSLEKGL